MQRKEQLSTQVPFVKIPKADDYGRKTGEISKHASESTTSPVKKKCLMFWKKEC